MQDILVLGAGKIGALICGLLAESGDYHVQLGDAQAGAAAEVAKAHANENISAFDIDATDTLAGLSAAKVDDARQIDAG